MSDSPRGPRVGIKGPLMFSAFFGVVAFVTVLIFASGGTGNGLRFDLAFSAAGIAFIVCLVIAAMLSMSYKENAEHLGRGDGVNLRSEDRLKRTSPTPEERTSTENGESGPRTDGGAAPEGNAEGA